MSAAQFKLDMFEGPLDLLLHLISKHKLNIYDIPIAEVSERIGFSNARYFSTCFKQFTSMTPREYREQKRNEPSA